MEVRIAQLDGVVNVVPVLHDRRGHMGVLDSVSLCRHRTLRPTGLVGEEVRLPEPAEVVESQSAQQVHGHAHQQQDGDELHVKNKADVLPKNNSVLQMTRKS